MKNFLIVLGLLLSGVSHAKLHIGNNSAGYGWDEPDYKDVGDSLPKDDRTKMNQFVHAIVQNNPAIKGQTVSTLQRKSFREYLFKNVPEFKNADGPGGIELIYNPKKSVSMLIGERYIMAVNRKTKKLIIFDTKDLMEYTQDAKKARYIGMVNGKLLVVDEPEDGKMTVFYDGKIGKVKDTEMGKASDDLNSNFRIEKDLPDGSRLDLKYHGFGKWNFEIGDQKAWCILFTDGVVGDTFINGFARKDLATKPKKDPE
jgi:hypothetical protein